MVGTAAAETLADAGGFRTVDDLFTDTDWRLIGAGTWIITRPMTMNCAIAVMQLSRGQTNTTSAAGFIGILREAPSL